MPPHAVLRSLSPRPIVVPPALALRLEPGGWETRAIFVNDEDLTAGFGPDPLGDGKRGLGLARPYMRETDPRVPREMQPPGASEARTLLGARLAFMRVGSVLSLCAVLTIGMLHVACDAVAGFACRHWRRDLQPTL